MEAEERIIAAILERFPFLDEHIKVQRKRRIVADPLSRKNFEQVLDYLINEKLFTKMHLVIGVDDGEDLGFIYILSNADKVTILLKQSAPKDAPLIKSVCATFPSMLWYERELVDLFGAIVEELPPGPTYPLPDGWPAGNYPMRKEWQVEYFDKETMTYNPPTEKPAEAKIAEDGGQLS